MSEFEPEWQDWPAISRLQSMADDIRQGKTEGWPESLLQRDSVTAQRTCADIDAVSEQIANLTASNERLCSRVEAARNFIELLKGPECAEALAEGLGVVPEGAQWALTSLIDNLLEAEDC